MKAISVRAPWWWFILRGKDIENRDWPTGFRGTVLLHASKWWNQGEVEDDFDCALTMFEEANNTIDILQLEEPEAEREALRVMRSRGGHLVGTVEIVDCVRRSDSPWFVGEYGFVLRNPRPLTTPVPFKGALGFFDVPDSVVRL